MNNKEPSLSPVPRIALRSPEAADALSISARTLSDWTRDNTIPHVRINGVLLYPVSSLISWLEQQATSSKPKDDDDEDSGGTECAVPRCHSKATDTIWWRGVLVHVCERHAAGNQQEN